jgi:glycosyltransferase involved in cell wall biosynthesis
MSQDKFKYKFTVFAPTYNRKHTLHRVYESLCQQTFKNFIWVLCL